LILQELCGCVKVIIAEIFLPNFWAYLASSAGGSMNLGFKHSERGPKVLALAALAIGTLGQARADIVVPGSIFEINLFGIGNCVPIGGGEQECGLQSANPDITVGGGVQDFALVGAGGAPTLTVAATESEINLGGGNYQIDVNLSSATPIFPLPGDGFSDEIGIGNGGPGLDLSAPAVLTSFVVVFLSGSFKTGEKTSGNLAGFEDNNPWNGEVGNLNLDGADTLVATGIDLQMQVSTMPAINPTNPSPTPEPVTVPGLTAGLGLILLRKRRLKAGQFPADEVSARLEAAQGLDPMVAAENGGYQVREDLPTVPHDHGQYMQSPGRTECVLSDYFRLRRDPGGTAPAAPQTPRSPLTSDCKGRIIS
jgi:hypothetical protein